MTMSCTQGSGKNGPNGKVIQEVTLMLLFPSDPGTKTEIATKIEIQSFLTFQYPGTTETVIAAATMIMERDVLVIDKNEIIPKNSVKLGNTGRERTCDLPARAHFSRAKVSALGYSIHELWRYRNDPERVIVPAMLSSTFPSVHMSARNSWGQ